MKLTKILLATALLAQASFASAEIEVLVGESLSKKGGGAVYTLDILSDGAVTAFQFDITVSEGTAKSVDLSKCGGAAASKHGVQISCAWVDSKIRVVGFSPTLQTLPQGWHNLGAIRVLSKRTATPAVTGLLAGDVEGRAIVSGAKVESID